MKTATILYTINHFQKHFELLLIHFDLLTIDQLVINCSAVTVLGLKHDNNSEMGYLSFESPYNPNFVNSIFNKFIIYFLVDFEGGK